MATYYISSAGNDSNAGTSSGSPWLTIGKAVSTCVGGDVVNLNGGNTFSENPAFTVGLTIQSYGTGQATIAGGSGSSTLTFTNFTNPVTIANLVITNSPSALVRTTFIHATDGAAHSLGVTVSGCTISGGVNCLDFIVDGNFAGSINNVTVSNNTCSGSINGGISFISNYSQPNFSAVLVENNTCHDIAGNSSYVINYGISLGACHSTVGVCYAQNNYVYNIGATSGTGGSGPFGIAAYASDGVIIQNNVCHDIHATASGADGLGVDIDFTATNCQLLRNICFNCDGAGALDLGSGTIAWNLLVNCGRTNQAGICIEDSGGTAIIYQNTVIQQTGSLPALLFGATGDTAGSKVYGNLFYTPTAVTTVNLPVTGAGFDLQGNAYGCGSGFNCTLNSASYTSLGAWQIATGLENSHGFGLTGNPCFLPSPIPAITTSSLSLANVYALVQGSPLVYAGLDLSTLYSINPGTTDVLGNTIAVPYSVGAIDPPYPGSAHAAAILAM